MNYRRDYNKPARFGVIGLTKESKSMLLDMERSGYVGCVYDFIEGNIKTFLENEANGTKIIGSESLKDMVEKLKTPRVIVMIVEDAPIDTFIDEKLLPYLSYKDYIVDAGSSGREESRKRVKDLLDKGIKYVGSEDEPLATLLEGLIIGVGHHDWHLITSSKLYTDGSLEEERMTSREEMYKCKKKMTQKLCCYWGEFGENRKKCISTAISEISSDNFKWLIYTRGFLHEVLSLNEQQLKEVAPMFFKAKAKLIKHETPSTSQEKSNTSLLDEDTKKLIAHFKTAENAFKLIRYAQAYAMFREIDDIHQWNLDYNNVKPAEPTTYLRHHEFYSKIEAAFKKNPRLSNLILDDDLSKVLSDSLPSMREVISKFTASNVEFELCSELLEYYEDFISNKLLCAKLFNMSEEGMPAELDLSALAKYQNLLRLVHRRFEKIEKLLKAISENPPPPPPPKRRYDDDSGDNLDDSIGSRSRCPHESELTHQLTRLDSRYASEYEACINHMEKDEKVSPLLIDIVKKRYMNIIELMKSSQLPSIQKIVSDLLEPKRLCKHHQNV